ncbi:MAG: glycoside hydrolase family 32 protein [Flavobacteriaceae bacterium]|nr:glycoside hydrolase family 32 protein [Flavobacteriaceae bacterium]
MRYLLYLFLVIGICCKNTETNSNTSIQTTLSEDQNYDQPYRPQFHFSPPSKWMNDPNGLVYHQGIYHLFYQYYPDDIVWGPMHWGHAVSKDLIKWEHKPIALYPDDLGYIFSGSAVVDLENTSGFGTKENPPLVAIYTYHSIEGEKSGRLDFQTQGIAYSLDNGDRWEKYEGNPVIGNTNIKDFRDPKVAWDQESAQWIMTLVAGDHAKFYSSKDLKSWELLSEFGKNEGAHGGVWECPDLFELQVVGSKEIKHVLLISINPGAPNGGSGTQYFLGDFDGKQFTTDHTEAKWIDWGRDNYAGVTYNNTPEDERIFIGWMSNWDYAQKTPTEVWRSAMTLPRTMSLHQEGNSYFLKSYPLDAISSISSEALVHDAIQLSAPFNISNDSLSTSDIKFQANLSEALEVTLGNDLGESAVFSIAPKQEELQFDRRKSGRISFEERFAGDLQTQPYKPKNELAEVRIIVDASSIEIFVEGGRYIFTNQFFPEKPYNQLLISGEENATLKNFSIHTLTSIWKHE